MKHYTPMISGDEVDAFTKWRHGVCWKPGERSRIKRGYRRRERKVLNSDPWFFDGWEYYADVWMCCESCAERSNDFRPAWMRREAH